MRRSASSPTNFREIIMKLLIATAIFFLVSAAAVAQTADTAGVARRAAKTPSLDKFVDTDGDGICDSRARGLGVGPGLMKKNGMKSTGSTNQPGSRSGFTPGGKHTHRGRQ
jgi:hypothetical protein